VGDRDVKRVFTNELFWDFAAVVGALFMVGCGSALSPREQAREACGMPDAEFRLVWAISVYEAEMGGEVDVVKACAPLPDWFDWPSDCRTCFSLLGEAADANY
jgi:hypothetical protein